MGDKQLVGTEKTVTLFSMSESEYVEGNCIKENFSVAKVLLGPLNGKRYGVVRIKKKHDKLLNLWTKLLENQLLSRKNQIEKKV